MSFFRYTLAGGVATTVHYAVLSVLVEGLGVPAALSAGLGALCGAAVAYLGNRRFTFSGSAGRHAQAVPRFLLVATVGAGLNGLIVYAGTRTLAWHYLAAQALATVVVLALTYRLNRSWTFA